MSQMYRNIRFNLDLEGTERDSQPASFSAVKTKMVCTIGPKTKVQAVALLSFCQVAYLFFISIDS